MSDNRNGQVKNRRKRKPAAEASANGQHATPPQRIPGRDALGVITVEAKWFVSPWFEKGALSIVIGKGGVGKSTLVAWLAAQAKAAMLFPGMEESVAVATVPRLKANGADLARIRLMDDGKYLFPNDANKIADAAKKLGVDVILLDPIDSYIGHGVSENDAQGVRAFLESLSWLATQADAAVIGIRHPGKAAGNKSRGSQSWHNVPRSIVELVPDSSSRAKLIMRHEKSSNGPKAKARYYFLAGDEGKHRQFAFGEQLDGSQEELAAILDDRIGRKGVEAVCKLIYNMFAEEDQPRVEDLVSKCKSQGLGDRPRSYAMDLLDIDSKPAGKQEKWIMCRNQPEWPSWLLERLK